MASDKPHRTLQSFLNNPSLPAPTKKCPFELLNACWIHNKVKEDINVLLQEIRLFELRIETNVYNPRSCFFCFLALFEN